MKKLFALLVIPVIFICKAQAQTDMTVADVFPLDYQVPGTHTFDITVRTLGPQGYGIFNIYWQQDNGAINTVTIPAGGAPQGHLMNAAYTVSFPTAGTYKLKVWVKSVTPADPNPANDTLTKTIRVFSTLPKKNVVLETFKHLICCPCYPAACFEDTVVSPNNAYSIANIYTVYTDSIYNADGKTVNDIYNSGHPEPMFDRFKFSYRPEVNLSFYSGPNGYDLECYGIRDQYYEPVKVSFKTVSYNATTRELKVKLNAQFYDELNGDYRFNLYLTEDSVKAYQACAPDENNYYHRNVLREMVGGPWGKQGSLPAVIHTNDVKEYEFTYTIPAKYNTSRLKLIGIVQTYNTDILDRRMLNSERISFANALTLSAETLVSLGEEVKVYPNPAKDKLVISLKAKAGASYTVTLYDMNGRMLKTVKTASGTEMDMHSLAAGNYMLRVDNGKEVYSKVVVKE